MFEERDITIYLSNGTTRNFSADGSIVDEALRNDNDFFALNLPKGELEYINKNHIVSIFIREKKEDSNGNERTISETSL